MSSKTFQESRSVLKMNERDEIEEQWTLLDFTCSLEKSERKNNHKTRNREMVPCLNINTTKTCPPSK